MKSYKVQCTYIHTRVHGCYHIHVYMGATRRSLFHLQTPRTDTRTETVHSLWLASSLVAVNEGKEYGDDATLRQRVGQQVWPLQ